MKVLFQRTKRGDFYTHYFIEILAYVVISKNFIWKSISWRLSSGKHNCPLSFIDSCTKTFLNKLNAPEVIVQNVPKRNVFVNLPLLGSILFQIRKKLQTLFTDKFTLLRYLSKLKTFSRLRKSYLRCYSLDLFTGISAVAVMGTIMVRPNVILKPEFVNIGKKLKTENNKQTAIQEQFLCLQLLSILWKCFYFHQGN